MFFFFTLRLSHVSNGIIKSQVEVMTLNERSRELLAAAKAATTTVVVCILDKDEAKLLMNNV